MEDNILFEIKITKELHDEMIEYIKKTTGENVKEILKIPVCTNCGKKQIKLTNHIYENCDSCHGELEMKEYKEL